MKKIYLPLIFLVLLSNQVSSTHENVTSHIEVEDPESNSRFTILVFILSGIGILVLIYVLFPKKFKKHLEEEFEVEEREKKEEIEELNDEDMGKVLSILKREGGRINQKDLRKMFAMSEAKMSLLISELEAKNKVEKIKKGRGNIIILKR